MSDTIKIKTTVLQP